MNILDPKLFVSYLSSIQFNKNLKHIESDLNYVELLICGKNRSLCFRTNMYRIHCIDQSKTFTSLLKSKILDFKTLSLVHVYRIEYVSYWQGPYRIRIDTADDRIVPALLIGSLSMVFFLYKYILFIMIYYYISVYNIWKNLNSQVYLQ